MPKSQLCLKAVTPLEKEVSSKESKNMLALDFAELLLFPHLLKGNALNGSSKDMLNTYQPVGKWFYSIEVGTTELVSNLSWDSAVKANIVNSSDPAQPSKECLSDLELSFLNTGSLYLPMCKSKD